LILTALVAEKGQIADHQWLLLQRAAQPSADRLAVMQHLLQADRQGGGMAKYHHGQGITDQHKVGTSGLHQGC